MTIYQISLEAFDEFMEKRSITLLQSGDSYTYPGDDDWYFTWGGGKWDIGNELIEFSTNGLAPYLQNNGVDGDIVEYVVFEAPYVPITIWVKTTETEAFVTVNEQLTDSNYTYRFYTTSVYEERFRRREAELYVLGQPVLSNTTVLMNEKHAILPMMATMKMFGAVVTQISEVEFTIAFSEKQYTLNIKDETYCENAENSYNTLFLLGGVTVVYEENGEMMINDVLLEGLLSDVGCPVDITCDIQNDVVSITNR